jgi:hypothetical protein
MRRVFPQRDLLPAWGVIVLTIALVALVFALAACSSGGGSSDPQPRQARVNCADVRNPDQAARCVPVQPSGGGATQQRTHAPGEPLASLYAALAGIVPDAHAQRIFQRGNVSRSQLVQGELSVVSPIDFSGEIEARFDAGCGGDPAWIILARQPFSVRAGDTVTLAASGQCGDMPLGPRTFTVTAWRSSGELLDQAVVSFTLVE